MNMRAISPKDIYEIVSLHGLCFETGWDKNFIESLMDNPNIYAILYEYDHKITGFMIASVIFPEAEIYTICVRPDMQNQGFASKILNYFLDDCEQKQVQSTYLDVRHDNHAAIYLYEKFGFKTISVRKNYYSVGTEFYDAVIMTKINSV